MTIDFFVRVLIVVVCAIAIYALVGPLSRIIGFPLSSDVTMVLRICVAVIAVLYLIRGGKPAA